MSGDGSKLIESLRASAQKLPESGIVRVFNYGRTRPGLIPLWAGEGDTATPPEIFEAASQALRDGETFYTYQLGIPPLREALARYFANLYCRDFDPGEFFVTCGGMQAIQLAMQMTAGPGDEVVIMTPTWPNFVGAAIGQGAVPKFVSLDFGADGWTLDLDKLFEACGPKTRVIVVNSPANPSGWTASEDDLRQILEFARSRGLWIIADEIYGRFSYDGAVAPSFQTMCNSDDKILFAQTFSKNWAMTGWRMGWLQGPAALGQVVENLVQYNTSGVATFLQKAGVAALENGEEFARGQIARAAEGRRIVCSALEPFNNVRFAWPKGAFYLFFGVEGQTNSMETALRLVDEANIGLAPGSAFGAAGEGYFRVCYLRSPEGLTEAMNRLTTWLRANGADA
ncbi:MAG: pyridoxal phosphate-dependent aminotransferase [Hyphomicrobiaceae bacterium]|nr:pyridoxal phosphate-dependent aminotransferase [Hyphomicrobiaceae bacterium]